MRILLLMLALGGISGGVWVAQKYKIEGLDHFSLKSRGDAIALADDASERAAQHPSGTIRIATFDLHYFTFAKLGKPAVVKSVVDVLRRFDAIALQGLSSPRDDLMTRLVDQLNSTGRRYEFVIGPRSGREPNTEQFAFVFDAASIDIDRTATYTVADPGRLLRHDPLVASFSVRGPAAQEAFTFKLVNVHVEPDPSGAELATLAEVYRAVQRDGQEEDDVILLGDFSADEHRLRVLNPIPNLTAALSATPTTTRGTKACDNLLFSRDATIEYTGHSGVVDICRELNLTVSQALEISEHLPVWAEFSIYEGGLPGRLARR